MQNRLQTNGRFQFETHEFGLARALFDAQTGFFKPLCCKSAGGFA
jgi:hypothetical protein